MGEITVDSLKAMLAKVPERNIGSPVTLAVSLYRMSDIIARLEELEFERLMLAKLGADEPMFLNPMDAAQAARIRDHVLEENS